MHPALLLRRRSRRSHARSLSRVTATLAALSTPISPSTATPNASAAAPSSSAAARISYHLPHWLRDALIDALLQLGCTSRFLRRTLHVRSSTITARAKALGINLYRNSHSAAPREAIRAAYLRGDKLEAIRAEFRCGDAVIRRFTADLPPRRRKLPQ